MSSSKKIQHNAILEFGLSNDPITGFLSNSSAYGFELDGVMWSSVEHYMLAKRFTGTPLEEKIRLSDSVWKARCLSRERVKIVEEDGWSSKRRTLPAEESSNWHDNIQILLERAICAKFSSPRLLYKLEQTRHVKLVDISHTIYSQYTGSILEKIRAHSHRLTIEFPSDDLPFSILDEENVILFENLLRLLNRIRMEEGQREIFPEMIEDLIFNITESDSLEEKALQTDLITLVVTSPSWNNMFTTTPNFRTVLEDVREKYSLNSIVAHLLMRLFRWLIMSPKRDVKYALERLNNINEIEIIFPPSKRPWRKGAPPCPLLVPKNNISVVPEDILSVIYPNPKEDEKIWLGVLACSTATRLKLPGGITESVYETFPYANMYSINLAEKGRKGFDLGSIVLSRPRYFDSTIVPSSTFARNIVSLFAEATERGDLVYDTKENRKKWFKTSLDQFSTIMLREEPILALSKTQVERYLDIIFKFSSQHPNISIIITEGDVVSRKSLPTISTQPILESYIKNEEEEDDLSEFTEKDFQKSRTISSYNLPVDIAKKAILSHKSEPAGETFSDKRKQYYN